MGSGTVYNCREAFSQEFVDDLNHKLMRDKAGYHMEMKHEPVTIKPKRLKTQWGEVPHPNF